MADDDSDDFEWGGGGEWGKVVPPKAKQAPRYTTQQAIKAKAKKVIRSGKKKMPARPNKRKEPLLEGLGEALAQEMRRMVERKEEERRKALAPKLPAPPTMAEVEEGADDDPPEPASSSSSGVFHLPDNLFGIVQNYAELSKTLPSGFKLTPRQEEALKILAGPQRHTKLVGGSRSGKSLLLVLCILARAIMYPNSRHIILRFRMNAVRRSIWLDTLPKVLRLRFPSIKPEWHEQDGYLRLSNGSEIWISGLDDKDRVEKILGMEFTSISFEECSQIPFHSVTLALTRLAQKTPGCKNRAYYCLNPVGKFHWTYRQFELHKHPDSMLSLDDPENYASFYINPEDNKENIDEAYLASLRAMPEKYRQRFYEGKYVDQYDNALWNMEIIERYRVSEEDVPQLQRIVIGVDPSGASGEDDATADAIGLCAAGISYDGHIYILEDATMLGSPEQWGRRAIQLYDKYSADKIVAEKNFGGDMVRSVIQNAGKGRTSPIKLVTASRGKTVRAEPISALYEVGKVHHVGRFPELEDEMCAFTTAGYKGLRSPNRCDASVWSVTELSGGATTLGLSDLINNAGRIGPTTFDPTLPYSVNDLKALQAAAVESDQAKGWVFGEEKSMLGKADGSALGLGLDKIARSTDLIKPDSSSMPSALHCPACSSISIVTLPGGANRCSSCGNQFNDRAFIVKGLSRTEYFDL